MFKLILWIGAVVLGYMAWKSGDMREQTGDIAYLKQAIGWGIASLACVGIAVYGKSGSKKKAKAGSASGW